MLLALVGPALAPARAEEARRVVSIGGAATEILYDLGLQDRIVAVDTTSQVPPEALQTKPTVGYMRSLSAEGVLSTRPDLVVAVEGAGPREALDLVRQAGTPVLTVPDRPTADGVTDKIDVLAKAFHAEAAAGPLLQGVRKGFADLAAARARIDRPVRVLFVLSLQNGRSMVGGRNSTADGIIALAGGVNAAADIEGYKPMADEAITAAAPDVILTMRNGGHAIAPDTLFALPAYEATPAARGKALVAMDGLLLLGFGPRTPEAARMLMHALYPTLAAAGP